MEARQRLLDLDRMRESFPFFVEKCFSLSVDILKNGEWTGGPFPISIAQWMQENDRTLRVSAKDHFKSMSFYAHIMWKVFCLQFYEKNREINYFSYAEGMAAYHLTKIKTAVKCNPFFENIIDLKGQADSIISYSWNGRNKITVHPRGLLEFKRGIHCNDVYVDDPFQDPETKLIPTKITKINEIMKTQIMDMFQNELHICGTAQTNHDFYFDDAFTGRFSRKILPAIVDEKNRVALWPEWMTFEELMHKKNERGLKIFNQEYLCSPVYSENAYIEKERLMERVDPSLVNFNLTTWKAEVERRKAKAKELGKNYQARDMVAGWDLGKKGHPASFSVFERKGDKRIQRHQKWFDHVDYTQQLSYIKAFMEAMNIYRIFYDATRGELEMLVENGSLPGEFEGVHFTFKSKHSMAAAMDRSITNKNITFLNESRMLNQILIVNNDLQAPETPEGHGDSFWSIGLSFMDTEAEGVDISLL